MTIPRKQNQLLVLDGGTGREIERCGGPFRQPEWSALSLYENPQVVQQVHESFLQAGAKALTTNTYAIVPFHLGKERFQRDGKRLLNLAVDLAVQARGAADDVLILGSIPPLCGSYEADAFNETEAEPVLDMFLDAFRDRVDVLLLETVGSTREAQFYLERIEKAQLGIPVWLSFCLKSEYGERQPPLLLTGQSLTDSVHSLQKLTAWNAVETIMVNCCDVRLVTSAIQELSSLVAGTTIRLGAYPNAFSIPPPDAANQTLRQVDYNIGPDFYHTQAQEWIRHGASVIGGCCGVGPEHIHALCQPCMVPEQ